MSNFWGSPHASGDALDYDQMARDASNIITLVYDTPFTISNGTFDAWFTSWEVSIAGGESFEVEIVTNKAKYTRILYPYGADMITFKEGKFNPLGLKMGSEKITRTEL